MRVALVTLALVVTAYLIARHQLELRARSLIVPPPPSATFGVAR